MGVAWLLSKILVEFDGITADEHLSMAIIVFVYLIIFTSFSFDGMITIGA